jgi:hypothetical protein
MWRVLLGMERPSKRRQRSHASFYGDLRVCSSGYRREERLSKSTAQTESDVCAWKGGVMDGHCNVEGRSRGVLSIDAVYHRPAGLWRLLSQLVLCVFVFVQARAPEPGTGEPLIRLFNVAYPPDFLLGISPLPSSVTEAYLTPPETNAGQEQYPLDEERDDPARSLQLSDEDEANNRKRQGKKRGHATAHW